MTINRNQRLLLTVLAGLTGTGLAFGQGVDVPKLQPKVRPSLEFRFDFGEALSTQHGPIPLSYRQVPHHPQDPDWSFTIPETSVSSHIALGNISVLPGVTFANRLTFRGGPQFTPVARTPGPIKGTNSNTKEIDQYGTDIRDVGYSLVYISGAASPDIKLGYLAEVDVRSYKELSIVGGYSASAYDFNIARGYDRYDALQALDSKPFSQDKVTNPYFGVRYTAAESNASPWVFGLYALTGPVFITSDPVAAVGTPSFTQHTWSFRVAVSVGYRRTVK